MSYWIREIAGWALLAVGLVIFATVYEYCQQHWIFEAFILMVVGIFVFRGGLHLLKVAVAARICKQAQDRLYPAAPRGEPARGLPALTRPGSPARR
jgi:hypothetical protein